MWIVIGGGTQGASVTVEDYDAFTGTEYARGSLGGGKTWGYGNVLLYNKYKKNMEERSLKELYWEYVHIFKLFHVLFKELFLKLSKQVRDDVEYKKALLNLVARLGFKIGQLKGCLVKKCFCLYGIN